VHSLSGARNETNEFATCMLHLSGRTELFRWKAGPVLAALQTTRESGATVRFPVYVWTLGSVLGSIIGTWIGAWLDAWRAKSIGALVKLLIIQVGGTLVFLMLLLK